MTSQKKKITVTFAPGAFDQFDGTQQELDELLAEIQRMAESGELEENSISIDSDDVLDSLTEEDRDQVMQALAQMTEAHRRNLQ